MNCRAKNRLRTATFLSQLRYVGLLAAIGVFMAFLNPFGSVTDVPLPRAIGYWVSLIIYGGLIGELIAWVIRRIMPKLPVWGYLGVLSLVMTAAVFPGVALEQAYLMHAPIEPGDEALFAFYILLINIAVLSVIILGFRSFGKRSPFLDPAPAEAALSPPPPKTPPAHFLDRLPIKFRTGEVYAVSAEDHYLRVHTNLGEALILMRLADAVRELANIEGLQTHRSWWVAKQGLADVMKGDGKLTLKLKSGAVAPVSRTFAQAVREAGWTA